MMGVLTQLGKIGRELYKLKKLEPALQKTPDVLRPEDIKQLGLELNAYENRATELPHALRMEAKVPSRPDMGAYLSQHTPEEALNALSDWNLSGMERSARSHHDAVETILNRAGTDSVTGIDSTSVARGYGAPSYRALYGTSRALGPNVVTALTPINERRRTAAMISELLHDPTAGDRLVLDPSQTAKQLPMDARSFYRMTPEEQLGFLALTEKLRFQQDLPDIAPQVLGLPPTMDTKALIDDAMQRHHASLGGMRTPDLAWGSTSVRRALLTDKLMGGASIEDLPLESDWLKGLGGYARGGAI